MKAINLLSATALLLALSIPATAMSDGTEENIRATMDSLEQALNENNIVKLRHIYSDKAMVVPNHEEILDDNSAIVTFWDNRLNRGKSLYQIDVIDLQVDRNIAFLSAMWSATVIRHGEKAEIVDGYMSNVLERQPDGDWKIRIQNWN